jgi:ribosomal protein S17E
MNQFIKKSLFFSAPVLLFIAIMELLLRNIPNDYSYKKNYLDQHSSQMETLFLGSSHSFYAVNPEFISSKSFNAAHIAQSLDYDLEILKKYANESDKLECIVVPIDYFSLYNRLETGVEKWRIKNYNIYYGLNKSTDLIENSEILNGKWNENIKRLDKFFRKNKSDISCNNLGWGTNNNSENAKDLIKTGKSAANRHHKKSKSFFDENLKLVEEIIAIAKSKNAKVLFYTCPAYKTYVSQLNKQQLQRTVTTITNIASSNTNVKYFNFLSDKSFDAKDFFDADHLNEIGAEKFSKKMDSIIINLK